MKVKLKKNTALWIGLLLAVIWVVLIIALCGFGRLGKLGFAGWLAFLYVPISIAVISCCLRFCETIRNDSGTLGIPAYYSFLYLLVGIALNGFFLALGSAGMRSLLGSLDVILLAAYLILVLVAGKHISNVNRRIEKAKKNTAVTSAISRELGLALSLTEDQELHRELLRLKESVDYAGSGGNGGDDEAILNTARELRKSMENGDGKEAVRQWIDRMNRLGKARNA